MAKLTSLVDDILCKLYHLPQKTFVNHMPKTGHRRMNIANVGIMHTQASSLNHNRQQ